MPTDGRRFACRVPPRGGAGLRVVACAAGMTVIGMVARSGTASTGGLEVVLADSTAAPGHAASGMGSNWGTVRFRDFERPFASAGGRYWAIRGRTAEADGPHVIVLRDEESGESRVIALAECSGFVNGLPGERVETISVRLAVNDSGDVLYSANTTAATDQDQVVALYRRATGDSVVLVREGRPVPGLWTSASGVAADVAGLGNDGSAYVIVDTGGAGNGLNDEYFLRIPPSSWSVNILAGEILTVPAGGVWQAQPLGGQSRHIPLSEFDSTDTFGAAGVSADGSTFFYTGSLQAYGPGYSGPTSWPAFDRVLCRDNRIVVQENVVFDGRVPVGGPARFTYASMAADGRILLRAGGTPATPGAQGFAARQSRNADGAWGGFDFVARVGDEIFPGAGERHSAAEWGETFFAFQGDSAGNFVLGSVTDGPPRSNGVLVYNAERVLAREGDPVDLDGNGAFDDDRRIRTFGNDDVAFVRGRRVVVTFTMQTDGGDAVGTPGSFVGVVSLPALPPACAADLDGDGVITILDMILFSQAWTSGGGAGMPMGDSVGDLNGDGVVDIADLGLFMADWSGALGTACR